MSKDKEKLKFILFITVFVLIVAVGACSLPYFKTLATEQGREAAVLQIRSLGFKGILAFLGVQIMQVVIFIIPGEFVEIISGMIYGTWAGYALCAVGVFIGTVLIYGLVKWLGYDFITRLIPEERFKKLAFLKKSNNMDYLVFLLFLIPGTPKDVLTYFVPFTKMKLSKFLGLSTLARIPSVLSSTFAGSSLGEGNYTVSAVIFAVITIIGLIGIYINRKFMEKHNQNPL